MKLPMKVYSLDDEGNPIEIADHDKWGMEALTGRKLPCGAPKSWIIGSDEVHDLNVSTVFLGIDHNHGGLLGPEPLLWETMIFQVGAGPLEFQWRYSSRAEAIKGHQRIVKKLKEKGVDWLWLQSESD